MNTRHASTLKTVCDVNKRASVDACMGSVDPTGRSSVQAAEAAIAAAVQRRFGGLNAVLRSPGPECCTITAVASQPPPISPLRAYRHSVVASAAGIALESVDRGAQLSQSQNLFGVEATDAAVETAVMENADCGANTAAASTGHPPHPCAGKTLMDTVVLVSCCDGVSPVNTPPAASGATICLPLTTADIKDPGNRTCLDAPAPGSGLQPVSGPEAGVSGLHLSCGPELQTMDMVGIMTTAAAGLQASWSALSVSSSVGEASLERMWTGDCSAAHYVISALPPQQRRQHRHHQQQGHQQPEKEKYQHRDDKPQMGSFEGLSDFGGGGGGAQTEVGAAGGEVIDMDPPRLYGANGGGGGGGGGSFGNGGSNSTCSRAAVGRYGTLMMSSAGWRCTELYDMHDSLLLSKLPSVRGVLGGAGGVAAGGGDEGTLAGIVTSSARMGLAWVAGSASIQGAFKRRDSDLQAVEEAAAELSAIEEAAAAAATAGRPPGLSRGLPGYRPEVANTNRQPYDATMTSTNEPNSGTVLSGNRPKTLHRTHQSRHRLQGSNAPYSPYLPPQQQQQDISLPLPQSLQLPPPILPLQHRLAATNSGFGGRGGSGSNWGAALEALLEKVAPRPGYYTPPSETPASGAASGGPGKGDRSRRTSMGGYRASITGNLVERSGHATVVGSMRRWAGQIRGKVSGTGIMGSEVEANTSDRSCCLSPKKGRAPAIGADGVGDCGVRGGGDACGLHSSPVDWVQQQAYGGTLSSNIDTSTLPASHADGCGALPPDCTTRRGPVKLSAPSATSPPSRRASGTYYLDRNGTAATAGASPALSVVPCRCRNASLDNPGGSCGGDGGGGGGGRLAKKQSWRPAGVCALAATPAVVATTAATSPEAININGCTHCREGPHCLGDNSGLAVCQDLGSETSTEGGTVTAAAATPAAATVIEHGYGGGVLSRSPSTLSVGEAEIDEDNVIGGRDATPQCRTQYHHTSSCTSPGGTLTADGYKVTVSRGARGASAVSAPPKQPSSSIANRSGDGANVPAGRCKGLVSCGLFRLLFPARNKATSYKRAPPNKNRESSSPCSARGKSGRANGSGAASSAFDGDKSRQERLVRIAPLAAAVFSP